MKPPAPVTRTRFSVISNSTMLNYRNYEFRIVDLAIWHSADIQNSYGRIPMFTHLRVHHATAQSWHCHAAPSKPTPQSIAFESHIPHRSSSPSAAEITH